MATAKKTKTVRRGRPGRAIRAFGESKSVGEWFKDKRCKASSTAVILKRIAGGWKNQDAITTPARAYSKS